MLCSECGAEARYRVTEAGVQTTLCGRCADELCGWIDLDALLSGFRKPRAGGDECPYCGTTRQQAVETGLVGCPLCYEVFPADVWHHYGLDPAPRSEE